MGGWSECDWGSEFERVGWGGGGGGGLGLGGGGGGGGGGKFGLLIIDWYVAWVM